MPIKLLILVCVLGGFITRSAVANLRVVTTTEDLASITKAIGGEFISVSSIAKGTQDPHYVEAKPSFLVLVSRADLVLSLIHI